MIDEIQTQFAEAEQALQEANSAMLRQLPPAIARRLPDNLNTQQIADWIDKHRAFIPDHHLSVRDIAINLGYLNKEQD